MKSTLALVAILGLAGVCLAEVFFKEEFGE